METGLASALAAWAGSPSLASSLRDPGASYLVLDARDGRVLHAAPAAQALETALGTVDQADIARQIAGAAVAEGAPRLARLRLDPRRIAPPALCLLARGARDDGASVVLMVPVGPLTLPRPRTNRGIEPGDRQKPTETPATPPPAPEVPVDASPTVGARFLWRSDAGGTLTTVTGADGGFARLLGADWRGLAEAGTLAGAASVLDDLDARRTFRAMPASLDLGGGPVEIELSGAPLGRGDAAFSGFGGFGLVRRVPPLPAARDGDAPEPAVPPTDDDAREIVQLEETDAAAVSGHAAASVPDPADASLSVAEHAAFRDIARALGARYAGDDEVEPSGDAGGTRPAGAAVMPFPGAHSERSAPPPADPGRTPSRRHHGFLDGLPVPALIHRGDAILAANRPLLDLAGFHGVDTLREAGLGRLFRGLTPDEATGGERRTVIETADGLPCPVEATGGPCNWEGEPASCLVLRRLGEDDLAQALAAERLARQAQAARARSVEAALDALDAGVLTLDGAGRVVALNRAAAALFGCDPREVVGGDFANLFDASCAASVALAVRGAGEPPHAVTAGGRSVVLALAPTRADGHRVAVLHAAPAVASPAGPPEAVTERSAIEPRGNPLNDRPALLGRLERELRNPMSGIVELTDAMLREPFGPLGDPRYRACLADIKVTGERMLERVTELLDLAAVEAGTIDLDPRPLPLNEIVAGCVARLQPEAVRGRIVLRTSFSADLFDPEADEPSVSRAAFLVIEHAIRRSAAGGQVIVSTGSSEDAEVALRVRGTVAGAARPDGGPDGAQGDAGFALPRALVEANGGRLRLSHRAEDGTLVEIIFPSKRAARA